MSDFKVIVLAAGKGTRMRTEGVDLPKVMRTALGRPLLSYVLDALPIKEKEDVIIVVGYKKEAVMDGFAGYTFAEQREQLGTGHAVRSAVPALGDFKGSVLICCGDMPLVTCESYKSVIEKHIETDSDCTVLAGRIDDPKGYGRVLTTPDGAFLRIVEERDCTEDQRAIKEVNSGIYVIKAEKLISALDELRTDNAQGEYYLTDVPEIMSRRGDKVNVCTRDVSNELIGVNTPEQLASVEAILCGRGI